MHCSSPADQATTSERSRQNVDKRPLAKYKVPGDPKAELWFIEEPQRLSAGDIAWVKKTYPWIYP